MHLIKPLASPLLFSIAKLNVAPATCLSDNGSFDTIQARLHVLKLGVKEAKADVREICVSLSQAVMGMEELADISSSLKT